MTIYTKIALIILAFSIYCAQLLHTFYNTVSWPFHPVNLFYRKLSFDLSLFYVVLHDDQGHTITVSPGNVIPLDHFLTSSTIRDIYVINKDEKKKEFISKILINRLNNHPWIAFDEKLPPAIPNFKRHFVNLDIEKHYFDLTNYTYPDIKPYLIEKIYTQPKAILESSNEET